MTKLCSTGTLILLLSNFDLKPWGGGGFPFDLESVMPFVFLKERDCPKSKQLPRPRVHSCDFNEP